VAVGAERRVGQAGLAQLADEQALQVELAERARRRVAARVGLRVDAGVAAEALEQAGGERPGQLGGEGRAQRCSLGDGGLAPSRPWMPLSACVNSLGMTQILFASPLASSGSIWRYW
jgi:hypothetical protein